MGGNLTLRFPCWLLPPPALRLPIPRTLAPLPSLFPFLAKTDCNIRVLSPQFPHDGGSRNAD